MNPAISVIIPAHNEEKYIQQTLHCLKQQTFQNFEIIVVANGCSDSTEKTVGKIINERLQLLTLNIANVSRARNHGANKAKGELLVFLDADTSLEKDALHKINSLFMKHHAVGTTKVKSDLPHRRFKLVAGLKNINSKSGLYKGWISGVLICWKKDFDSVNGYDYQRTVREHRNLILKLLESGKFTCIDTYTTTSMRRFQQWGLTKTTLFWLKQLYLDNFGDISTSEYEKIR